MNDFDYTQGQLDLIPYSKHHKIRLVNVSKTDIELAVALEDYMKNPYGMPHGALLFLLMDNCSGLLSRVDRHRYVTLDASIHYLSVVKDGTLTCKGHIRRRGRTTTIIEAAVYGEGGKEIACGTVTMFCVDPDADVSQLE